MSAEGAIEVMSQDAPTPWIRLPKFETRLAVQMARKMRCRNGARVEERQAPRPSSAPAFKGFACATAALRTRANRSRSGRFPREPSRSPLRHIAGLGCWDGIKSQRWAEDRTTGSGSLGWFRHPRCKTRTAPAEVPRAASGPQAYWELRGSGSVVPSRPAHFLAF